MNDIVLALLITVIMVGTIGLFFRPDGFLDRRDARKRQAHRFGPPNGPTYCRDCGQRQVIFERFDNFDSKTGARRYARRLCCPDYDPAKMAAMMTIGSWGYDYDDHGDCGNKQPATDWQSTVQHTGHVDGDSSLECPKCIITMEQLGILTRAQAQVLMKEK